MDGSHERLGALADELGCSRSWLTACRITAAVWPRRERRGTVGWPVHAAALSARAGRIVILDHFVEHCERERVTPSAARCDRLGQRRAALGRVAPARSRRADRTARPQARPRRIGAPRAAAVRRARRPRGVRTPCPEPPIADSPVSWRAPAERLIVATRQRTVSGVLRASPAPDRAICSARGHLVWACGEQICRTVPKDSVVARRCRGMGPVDRAWG